MFLRNEDVGGEGNEFYCALVDAICECIRMPI